MAWIYLIIAALLETAWTYCVKLLKFADFKTLRWDTFYKINEGLPVIAPLAGYIVFGVANVYFFSLALKQLSVTTAFAVWTALTLMLLKLTEVAFLGQTVSWKEALFLLLIMTGIIGLKVQPAV